MILKHLSFVFEPFLKSWKCGQNRPNGKVLAFTFCSIFAVFKTFENGSKRLNTTIEKVENDSKALSLCF